MMDSLLRRSAAVLGAVLMAVLLLAPQKAQAQFWVQTSRVVTPVGEGAVRVFLDTLTNVVERRGRKVKRAPNADTLTSISALQSTLIEEQGIGVRSVNRAFINYRFSIESGNNFQQEITGIHFLFRPGPGQKDVPVLYLDAEQQWVEEILQEKGTDMQSNEAALIPFRRHLEFAHVARQKETEIVEIGGQTVRKGFDEKKEALLRKVERLEYGYVM